jgi:hypothetical protein
MQADIAEMEGGRGADKAKVRLLTLSDLDGRTRAAQYVREMKSEVLSDLGGEEQLSTMEMAAVEHVSVLDAMVKDAAARWLKGEPIEVASIATLVNTFNRTAGVLGWQRRSRDVTPHLNDYIKGASA